MTGTRLGTGPSQAAAELLRQSVRAVDHIARVGGDEFLILLPETDAAGAARFVKRLRMAALKTMCDGVCLSISFGAATSEPGEALKDTVRRADSAMYASKRAAAAS